MPKGRLRSLLLIAFWYTCNILVILSNKYLLSNYGFRFPVFLTGCHMVACTVWGYLASSLEIVPLQRVQSRWQLVKISVLAAVFCLTLIAGNVSLRYIPVSFNQAIGATTPLFTAAMSLCISGQKESTTVYLALVPVVAGIVIASWGEPLFHLFGFTAALSATCGRAFKSVLQGVLLADGSERMDSMNLLRHMAPIAAILLLPVVMITEAGALNYIRAKSSTDGRVIPALAINASLAFLANLSNFVITKHTSALTLQVLGNAKGVVAAGISILIFRNPVTMQGALGYAIALLGVALYSQAKRMPRQTGKGSAQQKRLLTTRSAPELESLLPVSMKEAA